MDFYGITSVAAVTVICALAAQAVKATKLDSRWLPVICGALGIVSGLAATGAHQVFKQLSGGKSETEEKQE